MTGKNFRKLCQLRIGRLPTLENCNRGRDVDKKCRNCQRFQESIVHVLQRCSSTHFERIRRHDRIVDLLRSEAEKKGHRASVEPKFTVQTLGGPRALKPDLVLVTKEETLVIDVSIIAEHMQFAHMSGTSTLEGAWIHKRDTYAHDHLTRTLLNLYGTRTVYYGALIISMRGVWCKNNDEVLRRLGIPLSVADTMVVRAMEHSLRIHRNFMCCTERT